MADADQRMFAAFDLALEEAGASHAKRLDREIVHVEVGNDLACVQAEPGAQRRFQLHALGDVAVDEDLDQTLLVGARDQAVSLRLVRPSRRATSDCVRPPA